MSNHYVKKTYYKNSNTSHLICKVEFINYSFHAEPLYWGAFKNSLNNPDLTGKLKE